MSEKMIVPLPDDVRWLRSHLVDRNGFLTGVHPGLTLDKYVLSWDADGNTAGLSARVQRPAIEQVVRLSNTPPLPPPEYDALFKRWQATIGGSGFTGKTAGPLTLHLARASALENAGICFHRIYGFVYLPGTGLKGLAHAFAETIWLEQFSGEEKKEHAKAIEAVFGTTKRSGSIVFHDAWPVTWPRLLTDILNSHHPKYYSEGKPPGDWEDPIPVYFLSVEPGTKFRFAVAKRRDDMPDELLALARQWLIGGLTQLGAGAKTASGYGDFTVDGHDVKPTNTEKRKHFSATLELVTPAFLAGAKQQAEDCDLRPSTLRGQLRWWWRTLHAGFVSVEDLRKMEAAIWGDTKTGGAVRVTVRPINKSSVELVPGKSIQKDKKGRDVLRADPRFISQHGLNSPPNFKTTQGVLYLSYGMDEMPADRPAERKQRRFLSPEATWKVRFDARLVKLPADHLTPNENAKLVLEQAQAAFWLLCRYGGVGSKSRHGFGSLQTDLPDWTRMRAEETAREFRQLLGIADQPNTSPETSALNTALDACELAAPWPDVWFALDQFGFSLQAFAQANKRKWRKEALGLPRKIGISDEDGSTRQPAYQRTYDRQTQGKVVWLGQYHPHLRGREAEKMRHASPVHVHLDKVDGGGFRIRVIAFPSPLLADGVTSQAVLRELFDHLGRDMRERVDRYPPPQTGAQTAPRATTLRPLPGSQPVEVVILEHLPNTKPSGCRVQEDGQPRGIVNHGTAPNPLPAVGERVTVYREATSNPNNPSYRWSPSTPPPARGPKRR